MPEVNSDSGQEIVVGLVSTIIPVFNRPEMLKAAVESVLAQSYRPVEVIIADDGSTDRTPDVAAELVRAHEEVVFYTRHDNAGPGPARELGRRMARGEFIQYLDSDDRLLPNKFTDQVQALRNRPECDIAYGVTRLIDQNGQVLADPFKWTDKEFDAVFPGLLVDRWWCTHTPLYRRSLTDRIGPWCDLRWSQDWEYDARAGALRARLVHCQSAVSEHVHHDGERQTSGAAWTTDPTRLGNRVELLTRLFRNYQQAGVSGAESEARHFSRWCFSIARQCSAAGLAAESRQCLELSREILQGKAGHAVAVFWWLTRLFGHRAVGRLARAAEGWRSAGRHTLKQSFSGQVN